MKRICWMMMGWLAAVTAAEAIPSWIGVYGSYQRHNGGNPGTFTVLMNQDYSGLRAEVGIKVGSGSWTVYPMTRTGAVSINSIWSFTPASPFPSSATVSYYFHGYDTSGGHIWDSRNGQNYSFTVPGAIPVQWLGNANQWPSHGNVKSTDDLWLNIESWPLNAAVSATAVFTTNRWTSYRAVTMNKAGVKGGNDWWNLNLGTFTGGTEIEYAFSCADANGTILWAVNGGANYKTSVNPGPSVQWLGNQSQWPLIGSVTSADDFWLNVESWPRGAAVSARALYSVNGGIWYLEPMRLAGQRGNNDWWHLNLEKFPPGSLVHYITEVTDHNGAVKIASNGQQAGLVNGSAIDSDADTLPDDWERYWFGTLGAIAAGNPDADGAPNLPLTTRLEYQIGTEPIHSNDLATIALAWNPALPVQQGWLRLSYQPETSRTLSGISTGTRFRVVSHPGTVLRDIGPPARNATTGRFETNITIAANATSLVVSVIDGAITDNNRGVFWIIPVKPLFSGQPDSDGDGMSDAWEVLYQLDVLDPGLLSFDLGPLGDLDGDGVTNLDEFRLGWHPRQANPPPVISILYPAQRQTL